MLNKFITCKLLSWFGHFWLNLPIFDWDYSYSPKMILLPDIEDTAYEFKCDKLCIFVIFPIFAILPNRLAQTCQSREISHALTT